MADRQKAGDKAGGIYGETADQGAEEVYDAWADAYDADTFALGFRLPGLAAAFLSRHLAKGAGPILDAAAGTGQVGAYLPPLGYGPAVGLDISSAMLGVAARTGVYDQVIRHDLKDPLPFEHGAFAAALLIGALGPGHAPPACLRELVRVTAPEGLVILNVVAATWRDQGLAAMFETMEAEGLWREVDRSPEWDVYGSRAQSVPAILFAFRVT